MLRTHFAGLLALLVGFCSAPASGHELWFQPTSASDPTTVRLTFADSPAPEEAERVAEIAHTVVWGDGAPLNVQRLADGLTAVWKQTRPEILSAYANRGVVNHLGDSFVITLAAYSQTQPIAATAPPKLGVDDDQVRLLWVRAEDGTERVRATWRGQPLAATTIQTFHGSDKREVTTDALGEIAVPSPAQGPLSLLVVVEDKAPGTREGKKFSHTRYKATLSLPGASR